MSNDRRPSEREGQPGLLLAAPGPRGAAVAEHEAAGARGDDVRESKLVKLGHWGDVDEVAGGPDQAVKEPDLSRRRGDHRAGYSAEAAKDRGRFCGLVVDEQPDDGCVGGAFDRH